MGARASVELQQKNLFDQIAGLDPNGEFNRNQRTLFERLLLFFNSRADSELRLNYESSCALFRAIAKYKNPSDNNNHMAQAESK